MTLRRATLREGSLAAIVLDAGGLRLSAPLSSQRVGSLASDSPAEIVLGARRRSEHRRDGAALAVTFVLYAGFGSALLDRARTAAPALPVSRVPLKVEHVVELDPPTPAVSAPEPAPPAAVPRASKVAAPPSPAPERASEPPPPAEAGQVVAAEEPAPSTVDFTSFDVSAGHGQRYAGGVTAASGGNTRPVNSTSGVRNVGQPQGNARNRARPVGAPRSDDWRCPWPKEAEGLSFDEQIVVLRAVVRPDGSVASVALVSDPGYGFGSVAMACARRQQFPPATDEQGRAITATSPPIRFRFTRSGALYRAMRSP